MINNNCQDKESSVAAWMICDVMAAGSGDPAADGASSENVEEPELEDVARQEREYVRGRLREELKREPTDEEMDEWLRQQTEGH